ncbi:MAG: hypothetical protein IPL62_13980 [Caulobacteraceae bacterium]|jgi:hypothetical protein|nr:hypothetical protein [Caulobacteraceae bacterium]MBP6688904.1 hypothetical protein [Hyphomonadaceae bacterium]
MKRAVASLLFVTACATGASETPPDQQLRGCWINRDVGATTMRWLPDRSRPDVLAGARLVYRQSGPPVSTRYTLEPSDEGHSMCELGADGAATECWRVARGEGGTLDGGRVFIDAHGERLRIAVVGDGPEQLIFQGNRDGCD